VTGTLSHAFARTAIKLPLLTAMTDDALAPLSDMVADARVVAIGESFHHTHEQLVLRDRLVRHLVTALRFNTILLEVVTPGPNAIDAFVQGAAGDAESALIAAGARMWRNQETAALLRWLRQHNEKRDAHVTVHGMDVLAIGSAMRAVLETVQSSERDLLEALSVGFDTDGRSDQAAYNQLSASGRDTLHRVFAGALTALPPAADLAREQAIVVLDALEMLKAGAQGWTEGFALRDRAMANAARRLMDRSRPSDKFIVLSHNTHIAAQASTTEPSHPPMGAFLRELYGDAYFALGSAFGQAAFDPPIYGIETFPGEPSCIDQQFATLGAPAALIDLRPVALERPLRLQGVGIGPLPYTEYPSLKAFDALAFVDVLTNARQLVDTELSLDAKAVDATHR
jgi:erythromycin esterase